MLDDLGDIYLAIVGAVKGSSWAQVLLFLVFAALIGGAIYVWGFR